MSAVLNPSTSTFTKYQLPLDLSISEWISPVTIDRDVKLYSFGYVTLDLVLSDSIEFCDYHDSTFTIAIVKVHWELSQLCLVSVDTIYADPYL